MIPFDLTVSFVAGQTLALAARRELKNERSLFFNKPLYISLLWMTLIYAPSAAFFYHGWTAWNVMYAFDPSPPPSGAPSLLSSVVIWLDCTSLIAVFMGAFALAHHWIRNGQDRRAVIAPVAAALALLLMFATTFHRSFTVTSYTEFQTLPDRGIQFTWGGTSFWGHGVFWANVAVMFVDFGPLAFLYYWLWKRGRAALPSAALWPAPAPAPAPPESLEPAAP